MLRLNYILICIISLLISCSNNDDSKTIETNNKNTNQEKPNVTSIPDDFVIGFDFNNELSDLSLNPNTINSSNINYEIDRKGITNGAASFSSDTKSYIEIEHSETISLDKKMSISIWFYYIKQKNKSFYTILEKSNPADGGHSRYGMWVYNDGIIELCIEPDTCPQSLCQECIDATSPLTENTWNHLVGIFDGENLKLYLNGKENISKNIGESGISQTNFELFFGTDKYGIPSRFLDGRIDDFKLYNRAISETEIKALYNE